MNRVAYIAGAVGLIVLATTVGYWLGQRGSTDEGAHGSANVEERNVLYWYDPMYPGRHFDAPGKSPFMDMDLVPKYADEGGGASVRIEPEVVQNLGMRVAAVTRTTLRAELEAVGTLGFNERDVAVVQSRTDGFVERVYDRAPGDEVPSGAPLVDLLVPEWAAAQSEFLATLKSGDRALTDAARARLQLIGMPDPLIRRVEQSRQAHSVYTVATPIGGAVRVLDVRRGMTVRAGQTLARINGLDTVWLDVAVPEAQAQRVAVGARVRARLTAFPGEVQHGEVVAILPSTDTTTRTLTLRIELRNETGRLRPGMFARAEIGAASGESLLSVPSEAVIRTGERTLVMLAVGEGRFRPAEIVAGAEAGDRTVVLGGLEAGEQVVVSGQFLLDSEASLRGIGARPLGEDAR